MYPATCYLQLSNFTCPFLNLSLCPIILQNESPAMKKAVSLLSLTTPNSNRKRRRLKDTLAQLTKESEISPFPPPRKRPSAEHSLSMGSLLDISNTPETCKILAGKKNVNLLDPTFNDIFSCLALVFSTFYYIPPFFPEDRAGNSLGRQGDHKIKRRKICDREKSTERERRWTRSNLIPSSFQQPEEEKQPGFSAGQVLYEVFDCADIVNR